MAWKAMRMVCSDEAQKRLTLVPGTVSGRPASAAQLRAWFMPCSPEWLADPIMTSTTDAGSTADTFCIRSLMMKAPMSSGRTSFSEPFMARPIGVRAVSTMTASGMGTPCSSGGGGFRRLVGGFGLGLGRRHEAGRLDGGVFRPPLAADAGQLAQEGDGAGVVVARTPDERAVLQHLDDDLPADRRAHDRQRPVVVGTDAARRDVGMLGGEVGAEFAALTRPGVALLERHLVVVAVLHPDLEDALDVHLHHLLLLEAVLGLEELGEDRVVERLGAEEPDVEGEALRWLARLAAEHHRWHRGLAAHPDEGELGRAPGDGLLVGHGVGRVRVTAAGGGEDLLAGLGHARDGLPARAVALEVGDESGVDVAVLHGPDEDGAYQAAVLALLGDLGVGRLQEDDVLGHALDLFGGAGAAEEEVVDLGLPRPEAGAGPRAVRAALLAVPTVAGPELLLDVEGLVHPFAVVVAEHVVRAGDDAARATRAQPGGDDLVIEVLPVGGPLFGRCHGTRL